MTEKYEFIDGESGTYPVRRMCAWAGVSTSGFYHWRSRPLSATAGRRTELREIIRQVFSDSHETYEYRRVHAALKRMDVQAGPELVRALMRELGLVPCQPRPWRLTTVAGDTAPSTPDLMARDFTADAPGRKLVSDITYIHTWAGFLYLATVIDCHTKAVIGWAMADHMKTSLISDALDMAARNTRLTDGCIFHSDRGSQYTSRELRGKLRSLGLRASVGRTGVCWDNAILRRPEERARAPNVVPDACPCVPGDRPVHRDVLQSQTPPLHTRLPNPRRSSCRARRVAGSSIGTPQNPCPRNAGRLTQAGAGELRHLDFLQVLCQDEISRRETQALTRRIKRARFEDTATLETFDFAAAPKLPAAQIRDLAALRWLQPGESVILHGPVGVGKTHIAQALGHLAVRQGADARFAKTSRALADLAGGRADRSWDRRLRELARPDVLILDDFAMRELTPPQADDLYELITERAGRSLILTSNRAPQDWYPLFPNPVVAESLLDRLINNSHQLFMNGASYRPNKRPRAATGDTGKKAG